MIITKIELENIATHKSTVIDFQDGLNVLLGQNGTGKSTVLNMIGYNLFDFLQGNQGSYIRDDVLNHTNHGIVKVWIVGLNDDQFIISRTIGKQANIIEVSDAKTGTLLTSINDKSSLQQWLKTQIGLKPEFNLSKLFNTSVGVPQGTFTEPFLRAPQGRKDFFDPILQVDVYRSMWMKIKGIQSSILEDIHQFEKDAEKLKGFLINKDELLDKAKNSEEKLDNFQKSKTELEIQLKKVNEKHDHLTNLKSELDQLIQSTKELVVNRNEIVSRLEEKKKSLKEATESNELCLKTKKNYEEYEKLSQEMNRISDVIELDSKIEIILKDVNKIESSTKELDTYTIDYHKDLELQKKIEKQQELISKIQNDKLQMSKIRENYTSLSKDINDKEKALTKYSQIKSKLTDLEKISENQRILENEIIKLEAELNQLKMNKEHSKNGKCPILNEQCKNVKDKSLEQIFEKKIKELEIRLHPNKKEFQANEQKLVDFERIKKEYEDLRESYLKLELYKNQKLNLGRDIQEIKNNLKDESNEREILTKLKKNKASLELNVNQYHILKDKFENTLPKLNDALKKLQNEKESLVESLGFTKKAKKPSEDFFTTFESITDKMNKIREDHDIFQMNEKLGNRLPELTSLAEELEKKLKEANDKLKIEEVTKERIEKSFDMEEYNIITMKKEEINKSYIKIEENIKNERSNFEEYSQQIDIMLIKEQELTQIDDKLESLEFLEKFIDTIRTWYKEASPKITESLLKRVNLIASEIYRDLFESENIELKWENDYNVKIETINSTKEYRQLSGGEQMAAALAIRLAVLKVLTNADFAFFDEPTTNLDKDKRSNLAKCIHNIKGFRQIFVISHDDTFEENAENVIRFTKDENEITHVQFLSN